MGGAASLHVAEAQNVIVADVADDIAVCVGRDEVPVVFSSQLADQRFLGLLAFAGYVHAAPIMPVRLSSHLDTAASRSAADIEGSRCIGVSSVAGYCGLRRR